MKTRSLLLLALLAAIGLSWHGGGANAAPGVMPGYAITVGRTIGPCNCSSDAARIQAGLDALAGTGGTLTLAPGTWRLTTPIHPRSGETVSAYGATLRSTVAPGSPVDPTNSPVVAALGTNHAGISTTLNSTAAVGAMALSTVVSIPAGQTIAYGDGAVNVVQTAEVLSVAGSGPYTLTLSDPVAYAFTTGVTVATVDPVHDLKWLGGTITGTGAKVFEVVKGYRIEVKDLSIGPDGSGNTWSGSEVALTFDLGCRRCIAENITVDGNGTGGVGISIESADNSSVTRSRVTRTAGQAYWLTDARRSSLVDCGATMAGGEGARIEAATTYGSTPLGTVVRGGSFSNSATQGILVQGPTLGVVVEGVTCNDNANTGLRITDGSTVAVGGLVAYRNGYNVRIDAGTMRASGIDEGSAVTAGFYAIGGAVIIDGWRSYKDTSLGWYVRNATIAARGLDVTITTPYGWLRSDVDVVGAFHVSLRDAVLDISSGPSGVIALYSSSAGDRLSLDGVRATGSKTGSVGILTDNVADFVRIGEVDMSSCATPATYGGATTVTTVQAL